MEEEDAPLSNAEKLVKRLRATEDSGLRTMGGGNVGYDADGKLSSKMWGNEPIMRRRNPDGEAAADLIEYLLAQIAALRPT